MPNWVQNEIIFENASDEKVAALIRELKLATESDERAFDFNKIIPMPESLNIESGSSTDRAIAYYVTERLTIPVEQTNLKDLVHNSFSDDWATEVVSRIKKYIDEGGTDDWDKVYEAGKQYMYNREHYGCYTWYEWCCRHWGTKWNACEPDWSLDDGMLVFQTAWSAPFPVIEALAQKYPDLDTANELVERLEDIDEYDNELLFALMADGDELDEAIDTIEDGAATFYSDMTLEDLAEQFVDEGMFTSEFLMKFIDFKALGEALSDDGYTEVNDGVLRRDD